MADNGSWLDEALSNSESSKLWPVLIPLHVFFAYLAVRYTVDGTYNSMAFGILMPIHELGHAALSPLGEFMSVAGGSLFQWGLPLAVTLGFVKRQDPYAVCIGAFCVGVSLCHSFAYMDSAFQMEKYPEMTFVSLGDGEATHDWQYLFGQFGLYRGYTVVAWLTRLTGLALVWGSLGLGGWCLWRMARPER